MIMASRRPGRGGCSRQIRATGAAAPRMATVSRGAHAAANAFGTARRQIVSTRREEAPLANASAASRYLTALGAANPVPWRAMPRKLSHAPRALLYGANRRSCRVDSVCSQHRLAPDHAQGPGMLPLSRTEPKAAIDVDFGCEHRKLVASHVQPPLGSAVQGI